MAYTERTIATDGTAGPFAVGFNYRDANSIKVELLDPEEVSLGLVAFSFVGTPTEDQPGGTSVLLTSPEAEGNTIKIYKEVDLDSLVVQWNTGSELDKSNLRSMSVNLMEMAQAAFDAAQHARQQAQDALSGLGTIEQEVQDELEALTELASNTISQASAAVAQAQFWAEVALDAGSTANPEEAAAIARDAAIAARDAALAAQAAAEAARDAAIAARDSAEVFADAAGASASAAAISEDLAERYANEEQNVEVVAGKFSARHYAETAQDIVDAGALRWNGSAKFVSTQPPSPTDGINGDIWFQRTI